VSSDPRPSPQRYPTARIASWQALASVAVAVLAGWLAGWHGVVSALLGGLVNVSAGVVFAMLVNIGRPATAAGTLRTMLRAEAAKVIVIVLQIWVLIGTYRQMVYAAFFAAFVVTVLVSPAAALRERR
jgi:F0F1-type ATP synthase assembly protein I